jgi:hexokinase
MIINSEWGGFAAPSLPRLAADAAVDAASVNPGQQTFEKMISGLYLGRVAMHTLLHADAEAAQPALDAAARAALSKPDAFTAPLVSAVDSDRRAPCARCACTHAPRGATLTARDCVAAACCSSPELSEASTALTKALGVQLSREALALTKEVCHLVTRRAARLSAAGVVAVLAHIGAAHPPAATAAPPTVAVDGGAHTRVLWLSLRRTR